MTLRPHDYAAWQAEVQRHGLDTLPPLPKETTHAADPTRPANGPLHPVPALDRDVAPRHAGGGRRVGLVIPTVRQPGRGLPVVAGACLLLFLEVVALLALIAIVTAYPWESALIFAVGAAAVYLWGCRG